MIIKTTLGQLKLSAKSLSVLAQLKLNAVISYKIGKIIKCIGKELDILNESENKLKTEYGTISEETQLYVFGENQQEVDIQYQGLLNTEVELNIPLLSIEDLSTVNFEPIHLINLDFLFSESESEKANDIA